MMKEQGISAIVLISTNPATSTSHVTEKLREIDGIESIYEVTGQYDIATLLSKESIDLINSGIDTIRSIDGVLNTNTLIILKTLY